MILFEAPGRRTSNVLLFLLALLPCLSFAQKFSVNGYVRDQLTGENLIGATVYNPKTQSGSASNNYGYYNFTMTGDSVSLLYSYVGYKSQAVKILLSKDTMVNVLLSPQVLSEITIIANGNEQVESTQMSSVNLQVQQIKELPALLGEVDVLKVLQLLPGVQSGNEGSTGIYVRGGGPDQNLILLDGVPVYNASHLFGFFSVFNADAVNHIELVKGGFPARYGGRLSSVIDIRMKEGNANKVKGEGSIGIISSKISVEGPIKKDKTTFIVSGRRTYIDLLARPIIKSKSKGDVFGYYFYDVNTKINHKINNKHRVYLSTYFGDDRAYAHTKYSHAYDDYKSESVDDFGLRWGNIIVAARWNAVLRPKLFSNLTTTYSRYRFLTFNESRDKTTSAGVTELRYSKSQYNSGIRDYATNLDFDYLPNPNHSIRFGVSTIHHLFTPGAYNYISTSSSSAGQNTTEGTGSHQAVESSVYFEDDYRITTRLKANFGIHASGFSVENEFYHSVQPRISARYLINSNWSAKASYASMAQYIHLLTNAGLGLPTDLWVPATKRIAPQRSGQIAAGVAKSWGSVYELSTEVYHKTMTQIIEYKDGASFVDVENDWQDKVVVGNGRSYGAEVLVQKKSGQMTGWIGYTLSWTDRQFDEINFGKSFPYKYDRRHDISVAMTHTWNDRMDFSMAWVYGTGNATSLPSESYFVSNNYEDYDYYETVNYYPSRNSFRMRSYHRLDLSFSFWKNKKWGQRKWTIGAYNAYSRKNPFFLDIGRDKKGNKKVIQYSLFPLIPSFTYSFKF